MPKTKTKPNPQYRNFVFTLNNPTKDDEKLVQQFGEEKCKYLVYGREKGEDKKTPHLQGYAELTKRITFNVLRIKFKWHIEPRKGSPSQAATYCKKDGDFWECGAISKPGKRNDLHRLRDLLAGEEAPPDDLEIFTELPGVFCRYYKAIDRVRGLRLKKESRGWKPVRVTVLWGDTGAGKTRRAFEIDPDLYTAYDLKDLKWWCGYNGEKTILIDEFRGHPDLAWFLRLLDGYGMPLQVKGGSTFKAWDHVIITSNHPPEGWYPGTWDDSNPLKRRISDIQHLTV